MFTVGKFCISVFQSPSSVESGASSAGAKSIENIDKNALDTFSTDLVKNFLNTKNKTDALEYLKRVRQELAKFPPTTQKEYLKKVTIVENWIQGKSIFNEKGEKAGTIKPETLKELNSSLDIKTTASQSNISPEKQKALDEFKNKNPITEYKNKLLDLCIKHPQQAYMGTKPKENPISLKEELGKINAIGGDRLPEYKALVETLLVIVEDLEYGGKTGALGKTYAFLGGRENVEEFKQNMRTFADTVVVGKRSLNMDDFRRQFDENRTLTEKEKIMISDYTEKIKADINKISGKDKKITRIQQYIESNKKNPSNLPDSVISTIAKTLQSIQQGLAQGHDGGILDTIQDATGLGRNGNTEEARNIAQKKAEELTIQSGKQYFITFENKKYRPVCISELKDAIILDVNTINIGLFQSLLKLPNWSAILLKEFGSTAIAAVGVYISKNNKTALIGNNSDAKAFFLHAYTSTVIEQKGLLEKRGNAMQGKFEDLFPSLAKNPKIVEDKAIQEMLKSGNVNEFYNTIVGKGATNGEIASIMKLLEMDAGNLKKKTMKEVPEDSKKFAGKILQDFVAEFDLSNPENKKKFDDIKNSKIDFGGIQKDISFLLSISMRRGSELSVFLSKFATIETTASIQGQAYHAGKIASNKPKEEKAKKLSEKTSDAIKNAGAVTANVAIAAAVENIGIQNIDGANSFDTFEKKIREIRRLKGLQKRTEKENDLLEWLERSIENQKNVAIATNNYLSSEGVTKNDTKGLMKETTETRLSNKELDRWIDTQVFISKYVEEKNFVDIVERNAAYMNLGQAKSVGELYGEGNKIDLSSMSSENGSMRLSETNILGNNSFQGMSELMNCKVEVGDSGLLTRTIRSPEGVIVAENVPLENIDSTIQQLGRFYALGLGSLAPYMQQVSASIGKSRPDKITGLDGDFGISEDTKFLKILATMLYGQDSLPTDPNIPNLIAIFNRQGQENNPKYLLRKKGIVQDTGGMNTTRLDIELQLASKKVT